MRTRTPRLLTTMAAAGTLALTACADTTNEAESPETLTATQTIETSAEEATTEAPAETVTTTEGTGADTTAPETTNADSTPDNGAPGEELPYEPVGSEVTISGEPATICIHGDGWGTNVWAGNTNTSCDFVSEVHNTLIEGLDAQRDNIRDNLPEQITVDSPVTGESYDLTCAQQDDVLLSCEGGADAVVYFY